MSSAMPNFEKFEVNMYRMVEPKTIVADEVDLVFGTPELRNLAMEINGVWHARVADRLQALGYQMLGGAVAYTRNSKDGLFHPEKLIDGLSNDSTGTPTYQNQNFIFGPHVMGEEVIRNGLGIWVKPKKSKKSAKS